MTYRSPFRIDPAWSFSRFIQELFAYYVGRGIQSTGYRLNMIRTWMSMAGRTRAIDALRAFEEEAGTTDAAEMAESLWMSKRSYLEVLIDSDLSF